MGNKNLRRLRCLVAAPTMYHLERLARMEGRPVGWIIDKLVREKMLSLRPMDPGYGGRVWRNG